VVELAELYGRPAWHSAAACRGRPPELWFGGRGEVDYRPARAICARCPVRGPCLEWALTENETIGLWAGTTPRQRRRLRRERHVNGTATTLTNGASESAAVGP
jgi:WhiB family transcriptional regulator, redox-sensing transcriptional regulator